MNKFIRPLHPMAAAERHGGTVLAGGHGHIGESETRFRLLVESVIDYAIFMLDTDGRVASWNAGAQRMKGYRAEEIIGRHFSTFYTAEDLATGKPERELQIARGTGRYEEEGWRLRKDGSMFWANVVITAIRDAKGVLQGFAKVTRDLTERRRSELELIQARLAAERANRAKSEFLARISHELRTPLHSMLILAELLAENAEGNLSPREAKYARTVQEAGLDLLSLLNDLLDLARIESGADIPLALAALNWQKLEGWLMDHFGPTAQSRGLRLSFDIDASAPASIRSDEKRLQQILKNLLSNAFKFTRDGSVRVRVFTAAEGWAPGHAALDAAPRVVAIAVEDTGSGIAPDRLARIFEAFQRNDGRGAHEFGGTGLGLSISRELALRLGGELSVRSEAGKGSVFTLYLPADA